MPHFTLVVNGDVGSLWLLVGEDAVHVSIEQAVVKLIHYGADIRVELQPGEL